MGVASGFLSWWPWPLATPQDTGGWARQQGECGGGRLLHLQEDPLRHLDRLKNNTKNENMPQIQCFSIHKLPGVGVNV